MSESGRSRRLTAVVSADVAGYSRLMGADEEGTLSTLKSLLRDFIDPKITEYGGRIVKTAGDGFLLEYPSVVDAVRCCIDLQQGIFERNISTPIERRMLFRIGINVGDVIADGDDIFGDGVNIAARLEAMADPGGICISRAVVDQVKGKIELDFEDLGDTALKNIEEPVRTYRIAHAAAVESTTVPKKAGDSGEPLPALPRRPSVAILPFRNQSGNEEDDYIADGIGLGIQTLLVQLSGLFLVNASDHPGYRAGKVAAPEAVKGLPVRYVLEGAVQRAGELVRVTVQLTDVHDGTLIWADKYERGLEDVFKLQDDVTQEVISSLGYEVMGEDLDPIRTRGLTGKGAWHYFLSGLSHFYKFTRHDNAAARDMFERMHELHPDKAHGPAYVATTHWFDITFGWSDTPAESLKLARKWAEIAIVPEDVNNGLGHVILGSILLREGKHDEGLAMARKGNALRPNCPLALGQLAEAQLFCGDASGAIRSAREALAVRLAFPPQVVNVLAAAYRDNSQIDLSIQAAREATRLEPNHTYSFVTLCSDYALAASVDDARRTAEEIVALDPQFGVSSFVNLLPYKNATTSSNLAVLLRSTGLPD
jgi:adenylate cyclase